MRGGEDTVCYLPPSFPQTPLLQQQQGRARTPTVLVRNREKEITIYGLRSRPSPCVQRWHPVLRTTSSAREDCSEPVCWSTPWSQCASLLLGGCVVHRTLCLFPLVCLDYRLECVKCSLPGQPCLPPSGLGPGLEPEAPCPLRALGGACKRRG
eukprot:gene9454-biopygen22726